MYVGDVSSLSELAETVVTVEETINDDFKDISYLFKKPEQPTLPLWEIQLTLEGGDTVSSHEVTLLPTLNQFEDLLSDMLSSYEDLAMQFKSILSDERIQPFVGKSKYDLLKTLEEEEARKKTAKGSMGWIDYDNLLLNYTPYKKVVRQINKCLTLSLAEVDKKLKVSCECTVVYFSTLLFYALTV